MTKSKTKNFLSYSLATTLIVFIGMTSYAGAQTECKSPVGGQCVKPSAPQSAAVGSSFFSFDANASAGSLLTGIYQFGLGLVGISALLVFVFGGIKYIWAGDKDPTEARKMMTNAITGLIVALISWLVLYTINPDLVKNFGLTPTSLTPQKALEDKTITTKQELTAWGGNFTLLKEISAEEFGRMKNEEKTKLEKQFKDACGAQGGAFRMIIEANKVQLGCVW